MFRHRFLEPARWTLAVWCVASTIGCAPRTAKTEALPEGERIQSFAEHIRAVNRLSAENAARADAERAALLEHQPGAAELLRQVETRPSDLGAKQRLADAYLEQHLYWNAYTLLADLVSKVPGSAQVHLGLAEIWDAWGEYDRALESVEAAAAPATARTYALLGRIRLHRREFPEGAEALLRAAALQPDDPILLANLGFALMSADSWNEARRYLERAVRLRPSMKEARTNLAIALVRTQDYNGALEQLLEVGSPAVAWNNLGALQLDIDQTERAYAAFARAVAIDPTYALAERNLETARARLPIPERVVLPALRPGAALADGGVRPTAYGIGISEPTAVPKPEAPNGVSTAGLVIPETADPEVRPAPADEGGLRTRTLRHTAYALGLFCILLSIGGGIVRRGRVAAGKTPGGAVAKSGSSY